MERKLKNIMNSTQAVILAAGKSTRFGHFFNKLLIPLCGKPLITHITDTLHTLNIPTTIVVGHLKEQVRKVILEDTNTTTTFVTQEETLGTGHALICSRDYWDRQNILVLNGDMPLVTADLISELVRTHTQSHAAITFVTAIPDTVHHAYGRVIADGTLIQIVEAKDFTGNSANSYPINAGIYLFKRSFLEQYITKLQPNNAQKQFYITDLIGIASTCNLKVSTITCAYDLVRGVNTLTEFAIVNEIMRKKIIAYWLKQNVLIEDSNNTWIDIGVQIGSGSRISPCVHLRGKTVIGTQCTIFPYVIIQDSILHDMCTVLSHSVLSHSTFDQQSHIGPFVHVQNRMIQSNKRTRSSKKIKISTPRNPVSFEL